MFTVLSLKGLNKYFVSLALSFILFSSHCHNMGMFEYTFLLPVLTVTNSSGPPTIIRTNHPASSSESIFQPPSVGVGLMQLEAGLLY